MTRFWETMSDDRARALVNGWGTAPPESLQSVVVDVARRLDRSGRPFEALGLLSTVCESMSNPSAVAQVAMLAAEVAANCAEPLAADSHNRWDGALSSDYRPRFVPIDDLFTLPGQRSG